MSRRALSTAISLAVCAPLMASGQESRSSLEEVVVTATKREMDVQQVPLAVTAISGEALRDLQITNVKSLEKAIPGLTIRSAGYSTSAIVRGAGSAGTNDIAVPFYIDGMYLPNSNQALAAFVDIERVEGLRGPQGTLFGRNTFGGLINIISSKPQMDELDYGAALTAGDYSLLKAEGMLNVPLGDKFAVRVAVADEERDPFVENDFNDDAGLKDSNYTYWRAQLRFEPTETLSINLGTTRWNDDANGSLNWGYKILGVPLSHTDPTQFDPRNGYLDPRAGVYVGCPDGDRAGGGWQAGNVCDGESGALIRGGAFDIQYDVTPFREVEETAYYLDIGWEVASHRVSFKAAEFDYEYFSYMDADFSSVPSWADGELIQSVNRQADLSISSTGDGRLQYTVGAYYYDDMDDDNTYSYVFASLVESWSGYAGATPETPSWGYWMSEGAGGTESRAVYAQADYSLTEKLRLTLGGRYTEDDRESIASDPLGFDTDRLFSASNPQRPDFTYSNAAGSIEESTESHDDYRLGAEYMLNDEVMLYGYWATAYIAGSIDGTTQRLLDAQENETFEIGVKATLLDGRARLNVALYDAFYEGLTTTVFEYPGGEDSTPVSTQIPGGDIQARGIEAEGYFQITHNFVADFGIAWDDSTYSDFLVSSRFQTDGVDFVDDQGRGWFDVDGEATPFTADIRLSLGLAYTFDMGSMGVLTPRVQTYYNSGYQTAREHTFFSKQDAYTKVDLSLNWESVDGQYSVKGYVNNATDEEINTSTDMSPAPYFQAYSDYSDPINMGVRIAYKL